MQQIRTKPRTECLLCGATAGLLYSGMPDLYGVVEGTFAISRCSNGDCGLTWLNPMPVEEDIGKAYATYYTHDDRSLEKRNHFTSLVMGGLRALWFAMPFYRRRHVMYLDDVKRGRVLDVGCGNGAILMRLKAKGWQVKGLDVDEKAIEYARQKNQLDVDLGLLTEMSYEEASFDAVFLNHVIEHLFNPLEVVKECMRILKPGGVLVLVTPNNQSFGQMHFGRFWQPFEVPRHIAVFSPPSMRSLAKQAGFLKFKVFTTVAEARAILNACLDVRRTGRITHLRPHTARQIIDILLYVSWSFLVRLSRGDSGEEVVLKAYKQGA